MKKSPQRLSPLKKRPVEKLLGDITARNASSRSKSPTTFIPSAKLDQANRADLRKEKNSPLRNQKDNMEIFTDNNSLNSVRSNLSVSSHSIGSMSFRSVIIDNVTPFGVETQERTIKELLEEIKMRGKKNLEPPEYVCCVDELPPEKISWNRRSPCKGSPLITKSKSDYFSISPEPSKNSLGQHLRQLSDQQRENDSLSPLHPLIKASSLSALDSKPIKCHVRSTSPFLDDDSSHYSSMSSINSSVPVNIIGCLQPVELTLARANQRIRHQVHVHNSRQAREEADLEIFNSKLQARASRRARHEEWLRKQAIIRCWLVLAYVCFGCVRLEARFMQEQLIFQELMRAQRASQVISRNVGGWRRKKIFQTYSLSIRRSKVNLFHLLFLVRIYRKRRAVRKILHFINLYRDKKKITWVVHRFVSSVKVVQRNIHGFLNCKTARLEVLSRIWDPLEVKYVKMVLKNRKEAKVIQKPSSMQEIVVDEKTRLEMEKQSKRWSSIDDKMEESIQKHRLLGHISFESGQDAVARHLLSSENKKQALLRLLAELRKEYYLKRQEFWKIHDAKKKEFSEIDAQAMIRSLHGNSNGTAGVAKSFLSSLYQNIASRPSTASSPFQTVSSSFPTFMPFHSIDKKKVWKKIQEAHELAGTFVIDLTDLSSTSKKKSGSKKN